MPVSALSSGTEGLVADVVVVVVVGATVVVWAERCAVLLFFFFNFLKCRLLHDFCLAAPDHQALTRRGSALSLLPPMRLLRVALSLWPFLRDFHSPLV